MMIAIVERRPRPPSNTSLYLSRWRRWRRKMTKKTMAKKKTTTNTIVKDKTLTRSSKTSLHLVLRSLLHKISLLPTPAPSDISFCFFGDNLPLHRSKGNRPRLCQSLTSQKFRHFPKAQEMWQHGDTIENWTLCRLSTDKQNLDNTEKVKVELFSFIHLITKGAKSNAITGR